MAMSPFWQGGETHPALRIRFSFDVVEERIRHGDQPAIDVAVSLLCDDPKMPFGKSIKCGLARALNGKRAVLSWRQRERISAQVAILEAMPFPPTELKFIKRLMRPPGPCAQASPAHRPL